MATTRGKVCQERTSVDVTLYLRKKSVKVVGSLARCVSTVTLHAVEHIISRGYLRYHMEQCKIEPQFGLVNVVGRGPTLGLAPKKGFCGSAKIQIVDARRARPAGRRWRSPLNLAHHYSKSRPLHFSLVSFRRSAYRNENRPYV
jgi:hypothetical protein